MSGRDSLVHLDQQTLPVRLLAQRLAAVRTTATTRAGTGRLHDLVAERYRHDFAALAWHGRTSHMRMVWQDADVQAALLDPDQADALAADALADSEPVSRLAALLLAGIAENRPSYLLTAAPNWRCRPALASPAWSRLSDMDAPPDTRPPMLVDEHTVSRGLTAVQRFGAALAASPAAAVASRETGVAACAEFSSVLDRATVSSLVGAINTLLDEPRARLLVRGVAGASTELNRMRGQCLEVMTGLPALLAAHNGDHAAVLGHGLVSHALDAKHLVAAIVLALKLGRHSYRRVTTSDGARVLAGLLDGAADGSIGRLASDLMRARLRQSVRLIVDRRRDLGIRLDRIRASLSGPRSDHTVLDHTVPDHTVPDRAMSTNPRSEHTTPSEDDMSDNQQLPFLRVDDEDWEPWDPKAYAGEGNVELYHGNPEVKWLRFRESGGQDIGEGTGLLKGGLWRSNGPVKLKFHVFADEMILCLKGEATIEVLTTGQTLTITPGDVISLPKGWDMIWTMSPDYVELYESADV